MRSLRKKLSLEQEKPEAFKRHTKAYTQNTFKLLGLQSLTEELFIKYTFH